MCRCGHHIKPLRVIVKNKFSQHTPCYLCLQPYITFGKVLAGNVSPWDLWSSHKTLSHLYERHWYYIFHNLLKNLSQSRLRATGKVYSTSEAIVRRVPPRWYITVSLGSAGLSKDWDPTSQYSWLWLGITSNKGNTREFLTETCTSYINALEVLKTLCSRTTLCKSHLSFYTPSRE